MASARLPAAPMSLLCNRSFLSCSNWFERMSGARMTHSSAASCALAQCISVACPPLSISHAYLPPHRSHSALACDCFHRASATRPASTLRIALHVDASMTRPGSRRSRSREVATRLTMSSFRSPNVARAGAAADTADGPIRRLD